MSTRTPATSSAPARKVTPLDQLVPLNGSLALSVVDFPAANLRVALNSSLADFFNVTPTSVHAIVLDGMAHRRLQAGAVSKHVADFELLLAPSEVLRVSDAAAAVQRKPDLLTPAIARRLRQSGAGASILQSLAVTKFASSTGAPLSSRYASNGPGAHTGSGGSKAKTEAVGRAPSLLEKALPQGSLPGWQLCVEVVALLALLLTCVGCVVKRYCCRAPAKKGYRSIPKLEGLETLKDDTSCAIDAQPVEVAASTKCEERQPLLAQPAPAPSWVQTGTSAPQPSQQWHYRFVPRLVHPPPTSGAVPTLAPPPPPAGGSMQLVPPHLLPPGALSLGMAPGVPQMPQHFMGSAWPQQPMLRAATEPRPATVSSAPAPMPFGGQPAFVPQQPNMAAPMMQRVTEQPHWQAQDSPAAYRSPGAPSDASRTPLTDSAQMVLSRVQSQVLSNSQVMSSGMAEY